jgi:hypothetical protein
LNRVARLTPERVLMATAAAVLGLLAALSIVPPVLAQLGRDSNWLGTLIAIPLFILPFALLIPAVMRPRSVLAAVAAALTAGILLIWGMTVQPQTLPRVAIHLAAILCLAALVSQLIHGVAAGRLRVLWIVPGLLLGFAMGYLAGGLMGLHIVTQFCRLPPLPAEVSSFICSG